jgi:hypothetical protein
MSKGMLSFVGIALGVLVLMATTTQGCGGGSGSSANTTEVCNKFCDKEASCNPQFAAFVSQCKASCANPGGGTGSQNNMTSCPGLTADQAIAMFNNCLSMACGAFETCVENICPSGGNAGSTGSAGSTGNAGSTGSAGTTGGHAGTTGSAGSTGSAGASGSGTCAATCAKAKTCCVTLLTQAGQPTTSCAGYDNVCASGSPQAEQSCQAFADSCQ